MPMLMYQTEPEIKCLTGVFLYVHTLCMRAAKAQASLRICADLPKPLLLEDAIIIKIMCTCIYILTEIKTQVLLRSNNINIGMISIKCFNVHVFKKMNF